MILHTVIVLLCSRLSLEIIGGTPAENYPFFAVVKKGHCKNLPIFNNKKLSIKKEPNKMIKFGQKQGVIQLIDSF